MGEQVVTYCDGCGTEIDQANLVQSIRIVALGSSGNPAEMLLCTQPEVLEVKIHDDGTRTTPKIQGCARKVLTKSVLATLYQEVAEYTGDETIKPFSL